MARTRSIKPEFWSDEKLPNISIMARLLYIGLWTVSDDYGAVKGHPSWLKAQLFPYDTEINNKQVQDSLTELQSLQRIIPYSVNDEQYYFIPTFLKHQKIDRPSTTVRNPIPPKEILDTYSSNNHRGQHDETETETETETYIRDIGKKFEEFWKLYPSRNGKKLLKKEAQEHFKKNIKDKEFEHILKAVQNYANSTECRNGYAKDAIRWLRNDRWKEWLEPAKETVKKILKCVYDNNKPCYKDCKGCKGI